MIGAIIGDIIGSVYEGNNIKRKDFPLFSKSCRFTDDSVLTIALADSIMSGEDYAKKLKEYYFLYPSAGYGLGFHQWALSDSYEPYNSWGNGSAMRVSPVGYAYESLESVLAEAEKSASVTHNHPEGIKGAQAAASAIFLARTGSDKKGIKEYVESEFNYDLSRSLDEIRPYYRFDVSCQGSVPESIIAFLESTDFEDAVRNAVSLGGDSDTMACITGGIAQAYYKKIPKDIEKKAMMRLDKRLKGVVERFSEKYLYP